MIALRSASPLATRELGVAISRFLGPGDVVLLAGALGAGKTILANGIGEGLGVEGPMTSPTFTLVRTYGKDPVVAHVDAWRLENLREVLDLGLEELLDDGGIALVEWGDAISCALGRDALRVELSEGGSPDERVVAIEALGPSFEHRIGAIEQLLAPRVDAGIDEKRMTTE